MVKVSAIQCPKCKDIIFSRAHHDYHYCSCGAVSIDGGLHYLRYGWDPSLPRPEPIELDLNLTKQQLYDDWNERRDKYGIIKQK